MHKFELVSKYKPSGDQPQAIEKLTEGINDGLASQVLLGVTGMEGCRIQQHLWRLGGEETQNTRG